MIKIKKKFSIEQHKGFYVTLSNVIKKFEHLVINEM